VSSEEREMENKELRELYFDVLTEIDGLTEVELGESNDICFNYGGSDYYWLYADEKDTKIIELCFHCSSRFKDNDEKIKAVHLCNQINKKFKTVKMFIDDEAGDITARADLFVTGILPAGNGFSFNDKERFVEDLLLALSAIEEATDYFFDEMGWRG